MKKVLISGAGGLVGSFLTENLKQWGKHVVPLVRSKEQEGIFWDPDLQRIDARELEGFDTVIHLAGEPIANARWNEEKKKRIYDSRVIGTRVLSEALATLKKPPKLLISASAVGFYGDRGDTLLSEESSVGTGFLAKVANDWEAATLPARTNGIRVVQLRFGVVLSTKGGALAKMLTPFRLGVGGVIGSGDQYMSWVSIDDVLGVVEHIMECEKLDGPINVVSPIPVTNRVFTKTLGKVLKRPTILPMPLFAARLAFGEMVDEVLLSSARMTPTKLIETGYVFRYPQLEKALEFIVEQGR